MAVEYRGEEILFVVELANAKLARPFNQTGGSKDISADTIDLDTKDKTGSDYGKIAETVSLEGILTEGDPFIEDIKSAIRLKKLVKIYEVNTRTLKAEYGSYMISSFNREYSNGEFATYSLEATLNGVIADVTLSEIPEGAGNNGEESPVDPEDPTPKVRTVPFAINNGVCGAASSLSNGTTDVSRTFRTYHKAMVGVTEVSLAFGNYEVKPSTSQSEIATPNAVTVAASIEYPMNSGTLYRLKFGGSFTAVIQPGSTAFTDMLPVEIPEDAEFQVRTYVGVSPGEKYPFTLQTWGDFGQGSGDGDLTASGTITVKANWNFGPIGLFGKSTTTKPSIVLVGDSIMNGQGDDRLYGMIQGFAGRSLIENNIPFLKIAKGGEFQSAFATTNGRSQRMRLVGHGDFTHAIVNHSTNDLRTGTGLTLTQMQAYQRVVWKDLSDRGLSVYQTTSTPQTSSTDGYVTLANQTVHSSTPLRNQWNEYLIDAASAKSEDHLTGVIDVTEVLEVDDKWGIDAADPVAYTYDGVHPTVKGHLVMKKSVDKWVAAVSTN